MSYGNTDNLRLVDYQGQLQKNIAFFDNIDLYNRGVTILINDKSAKLNI